MITQQRLKELLVYNPDTGEFTNRVQRGPRGAIGALTGSLDKDGYNIIQIGGVKYRAGRLAFLYMIGRWPVEVDHKDGVPANDWWDNLREATRSEQMANSARPIGASGLRGVKFDLKTSTWRSRVQCGNIREWLGPFDTAKEAHEAYLAATETAHGEFALHNRPQPLERRL
jgi:hypothetical protein